jgi:hypothetical protein
LSFIAEIMGAGASADNARSTVSAMLMNKPEDASDVTDLAAAKNEIIQLRKMAKLYREHLKCEYNICIGTKLSSNSGLSDIFCS